jgi:hypothetical protein
MAPQHDPRTILQIPTGSGQLWLGWILIVLGLLAFAINGAAAGALLAIGSGFIAWGTGARWLHHIEAKQMLIMERQAITCRCQVSPTVDAPPVS